MQPAYLYPLYHSPLGKMTFSANEQGQLTGVWFDGQRHAPQCNAPLHTCTTAPALPIFRDTCAWLDDYFSGVVPRYIPDIAPEGSPFRHAVWGFLLQIPYGQTATYGEIARLVARQRGTAHMSAQAIGGAVGHNPISIIIPCHRVVGSDGSLTGYAGGILRKQQLLSIEHRQFIG